jgi:hypothetical protein
MHKPSRFRKRINSLTPQQCIRLGWGLGVNLANLAFWVARHV